MNPSQAQVRVEGFEGVERPPSISEPVGGTRSTWRRLEQRNVECYPFRYTLKTEARTEYLFFTERGLLSPVYRTRSRTGAHGEDCYLVSDLEQTLVMVKIEISNSGRDYSEIWVRTDSIPLRLLREIVRVLQEYPNYPRLELLLMESVKRVA